MLPEIWRTLLGSPFCSKIFIGGLSFETTDEALKRYFEQFGPVADAIVMKDAVSRRSRGFGFITYINTASVDAALLVEQHIVDNRRVEAKRAVPRSEVPTKVCTKQNNFLSCLPLTVTTHSVELLNQDSSLVS